MNTYFGIKQNMTQTWDKQGKRIPVTVIQASPLTITQVKNEDKDGYQAVQFGFGRMKNATKSLSGHLKPSKITPRFIREVKSDSADISVGDQVKVEDVLSLGDIVTVRSTSKGRGFAGVIKRYGFAGGPRTHGQSDRQRAPGSIGQGTDPGRVHKGKKMPGRMGNQQFAIRSLQVVKVDTQNELVWISGPIPGAIGSVVAITKSGDSDFEGLYDDVQTSSKSTDKAKDVAKSIDKSVENSPAQKKTSAKKSETTPDNTETKDAAKTVKKEVVKKEK